MADLKPCPFCGSAKWLNVSDELCVRCSGARSDPRPLGVAIVAARRIEKRDAAWNARTPSRAAIRAECLREVAEEWDSSGHPAYAARLRVLAEKEERDGK
jgi:hypothetical protein